MSSIPCLKSVGASLSLSSMLYRRYWLVMAGWIWLMPLCIQHLGLPIAGLSLLAVGTASAQTLWEPPPGYRSRYVEVRGSRMHYVEAGAGDPILFIHGNPTSSYLWRNVMPYVEGKGRLIAVDLIGFGASDKPDLDYVLADHTAYLNGFIEALGLERLTLVIHDWGSFLGFQYAMDHPDNVRGIAFMESIIALVPGRPQIPTEWQERLAPVFQLFGEIGGPERGYELVVNQNAFIERLMPTMIVRQLSDEERAVYREPFGEVAARKPIHVFRQEIGNPNNQAIIQAYAAFLAASPIPKLLFDFTPGAITSDLQVEWVRANLPNVTIVDGGVGIHYVQEDEPKRIGQAIAEWMTANGLASGGPGVNREQR